VTYTFHAGTSTRPSAQSSGWASAQPPDAGVSSGSPAPVTSVDGKAYSGLEPIVVDAVLVEDDEPARPAPPLCSRPVLRLPTGNGQDWG
jgi:hypothetical protein